MRAIFSPIAAAAAALVSGVMPVQFSRLPRADMSMFCNGPVFELRVSLRRRRQSVFDAQQVFFEGQPGHARAVGIVGVNSMRKRFPGAYCHTPQERQ